MKRPPLKKGLLKRFAVDRRGLAALEFALTLPLLLLLYLGGFEATDAIATYRKLADTTVTLADVTAQYTTMSAGDVQTVFNASAQMMTPLSTANLGIVLSEISTDALGAATVTWSRPYNGSTPLTVGSSVTLPAGLSAPNSSYIEVQTAYRFLLPTGYAFTGPLNMTDQIYMQPRASQSIPYTG